jgi:hypothetical protein
MLRNYDISVGIVIRLQNTGIWVRFQAATKDFTLFDSVYTDSEDHRASKVVDTGGAPSNP